MCGLAGFVDRRPAHAREAAALADQARRMAHSLNIAAPMIAAHGWMRWRAWASGHQRLSIIDLSIQGAQPMQSGNGRYVIAYNGEMYNFRELRQELETPRPCRFAAIATPKPLPKLLPAGASAKPCAACSACLP